MLGYQHPYIHYLSVHFVYKKKKQDEWNKKEWSKTHIKSLILKYQ